jgi:hypothetical protein
MCIYFWHLLYIASFPLLSLASQLSPNFQKYMDSKDILSRLALFIKRIISAYRGQWKGRILEGGKNEIPPNAGSTRLHNLKSRVRHLAVDCCRKMRLLRLRSVSWIWLKIADGNVCGVTPQVAVSEQCRTLNNRERRDLCSSPNTFYLSDMQENVISRALCWVWKTGMLAEVWQGNTLQDDRQDNRD